MRSAQTVVIYQWVVRYLPKHCTTHSTLMIVTYQWVIKYQGVVRYLAVVSYLP